MADFEGFINRDDEPAPQDVIGGMARASDLDPELAKTAPPPKKQPVHPLTPMEQLERPSPEPFVGRPDPDYPELDSLEPLYIPKFLLRKWGPQRFQQSPYYAAWRAAARESAGQDLKPSEQKRKK